MPAPPKRGRIVLKGDEYKALVRQVYERDGWRCRRCGNRQNLHPHHIIKRSDIRKDTLYNLVTVCASCHELIERHKVVIIGEDANALLRFRKAECLSSEPHETLAIQNQPSTSSNQDS